MKGAVLMKVSEEETFLRKEEKYRLNVEQQYAFLAQAAAYLRPDLYPEYDLNTLYYDTDDYALINRCLEKPMYKEKLRMRSYGNPALGKPVYLEVKKKFGVKGQKRRAALVYTKDFDYIHPEKGLGDSQIDQELSWVMRKELTPKVFVAYHRMAFAGADFGSLRLTFDTQIRYRVTDMNLFTNGTEKLLPEAPQVLMEVKLAGHYPIWLTEILTRMKLFPESFSKYGSIYKRLAPQLSLAKAPAAVYEDTPVLRGGEVTVCSHLY
jgi:hypothetical protein